VLLSDLPPARQRVHESRCQELCKEAFLAQFAELEKQAVLLMGEPPEDEEKERIERELAEGARHPQNFLDPQDHPFLTFDPLRGMMGSLGGTALLGGLGAATGYGVGAATGSDPRMAASLGMMAGAIPGALGGLGYGLRPPSRDEVLTRREQMKEAAFKMAYIKRAQELAGNDYVEGPPAGLPGPQTYPPLFQTPEITTEPPHPLDESAGEAEIQKNVQKHMASQSKYKTELSQSQV